MNSLSIESYDPQDDCVLGEPADRPAMNWPFYLETRPSRETWVEFIINAACKWDTSTGDRRSHETETSGISFFIVQFFKPSETTIIVPLRKGTFLGNFIQFFYLIFEFYL